MAFTILYMYIVIENVNKKLNGVSRMNKPLYSDFIGRFSLNSVDENFFGNFDNGLSICEEICDRYATDDKVALRYERFDGTSGELTYQELMLRSSQFANFLKSQGVSKGDRVACLLPRTPELLITLVGVLRAGAIYQPMFTAFGSGAIEYRLTQAETKLIVTNEEQWPKLADICCPTTVLVADTKNRFIAQPDFIFNQALSNQPASFDPVYVHANTPFLQMFTSGTTGKAKGVSVPAKGLIANWVYMTYAIGLRSDDNYWNVTDPGWAYGLFHAVLGPLLLGSTIHFNERAFSAENTLAFIQKYKITNLAAAPTTYRLLMASEELLSAYPDIKLRVASSAGEPLNPEIISWGQTHLQCEICDHYGQTETGMTSANFHALTHEKRNACMGYPLPGYRLVALDSNFKEVSAGQTGELAIDINKSPLFHFSGYTWEEKTPFHKKYYLTGDMVISNGDGSHSYSGRDDDIIASAGYRIGPADVENSLLEHPAVIESAVVGKPDEKRGFIVKAYIVLKPNYTPDETLSKALQQHVREHLSTHAFPREISFINELPKTPSGKLQRVLLRQQASLEAAT